MSKTKILLGQAEFELVVDALWSRRNNLYYQPWGCDEKKLEAVEALYLKLYSRLHRQKGGEKK